MSNDETAKWSLGERLQLVESLGSIKVQLARMEDRDIYMAQSIEELKEDLGATKKVAYVAKSRTDKMFWLGGFAALLLSAKDVVVRLLYDP